MLNRIASALLAATLCTFGACKKSTAENQVEKQAQFRAQQGKKALENYQQLVKKYPDSAFTGKAKERIRALQAEAGPAKK